MQVTKERETARAAKADGSKSRGDWRLGFESLEVETRAPLEVEILEGAIPRGLEGTLYRIGPGRWDVHGDRFRHWFDGDGMVHALAIDGGRVAYTNRFVDTPWKREEDEARRRIYSAFGTRRAGGFLSRFFGRTGRKNPANTNVVFHGGKLLALCEGGRPFRVDPVTLETIEEDTMGAALAAGDTFSAHPKLDRATGEMWNFGISYERTAEASVYRTTKDGVTTRVAKVSLPFLAMVHDFALTPTKVVFVIAPIALPALPLGLMTGQRSFGESLQYRPELGTRVGVFDRATGETRWSATSPFMMFHAVHAWDDGADVVVDVAAYPDGGILRVLTDVMAGTEPSPARADLERLRISPDGTIARSRPARATLEFPRVMGRAFGRAASRVYGVTWGEGTPFLSHPIAIDTRSGRTTVAKLARGEIAGEVVPVSKPGVSAEDDAWLLTLVLDPRARRTELRVYEAADLEAPPVARVALPHVVPVGFHGNFVAKRT